MKASASSAGFLDPCNNCFLRNMARYTNVVQVVPQDFAVA